ncbi:MAG: TfoX/Sxy family protein [Planctomycetaceae bacterium]|nr:TfoX/Sxy family protein [Planctomycetaceae bacterium]MCA9043041.1 TfoX/Sxy family protein [Planctomycetaceae bacterium]
MQADDTPIESLRNLGPKSGTWLREAGITTVEELRRLGAVVAYQAVQQQRDGVSLNLLWALAAGLEGIDWRELTEERKEELKSATAD